MIETYVEWKATEYFITVAVMAIIILACIFIGGLTWIYRMMCRSREKKTREDDEEMGRAGQRGNKEE